jgi:hypothetical protein
MQRLIQQQSVTAFSSESVQQQEQERPGGGGVWRSCVTCVNFRLLPIQCAWQLR